MSARLIRSLWVTRKSIDGGHHPPELVEAWDEWSVEDNWEGWGEACKAALAAVGDDLAEHRYVTLRVDEEALAATFEAATVEARVTTESPLTCPEKYEGIFQCQRPRGHDGQHLHTSSTDGRSVNW